MKKIALVLLAVVSVLAIAGSADARRGDRWRGEGGWRDRGGSWIVLYSAPYFQGTAITLDGSVADLRRYGFNDRAQSIRTRGTWTLCSDTNYRGDCVTLWGEVEDLRNYDMKRRAGSVMNGDRW